MTDEELHARIIRHVNNDHKLALYDILAHYNGIKLNYRDPRTNVQLLRVANDALTVTYTPPTQETQTSIVHIRPPMKSLGEARVVITHMAKTAAAALNYSPVQVRRYVFPKLTNPRIVVSSSIPILVLAAINPIKTSLPFYLIHWKAADAIQRHVRKVAAFFVLVHIVEFFAFMGPALRFFRVPPDVKWKWIVSSMLEGYPAYFRLRDEARRLEN